METAQAMLDSGRYIYTVFMCHLSIEKMLKGIYSEKVRELPAKTHNLLFLIEKSGIKIPNQMEEFIFLLNRLSVPTRYPEDLRKMQSEYNREKASTCLSKSREVLNWLKQQ